MLDAKGRCCGRKPKKYLGGPKSVVTQPQRFCDRCCRSYEIDTDEQIENFHWKKIGLKFVNRNELNIQTMLCFKGEEYGFYPIKRN